MQLRLKKLAVGALTTTALLVGSLAIATPAQAAVDHKTTTQKVTVGNHKDLVSLIPADKKEWGLAGSPTGLASHYVVKETNLKTHKVLYKKTLSTGKIIYVFTHVKLDKHYKSDAKLVSLTKKYAGVSEKTVNKWLKKTIGNAGGTITAKDRRTSKLQEHVNSTVTNVQVTLTEGGNLETGRTNFKDGSYVVITSAKDGNFVVKGYAPRDNYTYTYNSTTGTFKAGTIN